MLNKTMLIGRLGADAEIKTVKSGDKVCSFKIATNEKWTDKKDGKKQESTEWHSCSIWGKRGEIFAEYTAKGSLIYIEGKLATRSWEDKNAVTRYFTEIKVSNFEFLDSKKKDAEAPSSTSSDEMPF